MSDTDISCKGIQGLLVKDFTDESHSLMMINIPHRTVGIAQGHTGGFLTPVLESTEAVIQGMFYVFIIGCKYSEHTAFFMQFIVIRQTIHRTASPRRKGKVKILSEV